MKTTHNPQKALDSTKRTQHVNKDVVKTIPEWQEGTLEFFNLTTDVTDNDLEKEYVSRGLVPASPMNICEYDRENPEKMDEMQYVATHWKDAAGKRCFATFHRWYGERIVDVIRYVNDWDDSWWFAGLRKPSALESEPSLDSQDLELRIEKLERFHERAIELIPSLADVANQ